MVTHRTTTGTAALLKQIDRDIASVDREMKELTDHRQDLQTLREAIATIVLNGAKRPKRRQQGETRVDALKAIINESDKPLTVDDMLAKLKQHGRGDDDKRLVHSTVSYLARTGAVERVERGLWTKPTGAKAKAAQAA